MPKPFNPIVTIFHNDKPMFIVLASNTCNVKDVAFGYILALGDGWTYNYYDFEHATLPILSFFKE